MKSIIQQLIEDDTFLAETKELIQSKIFGQLGEAYDSFDGLQPATATECEFEEGPKIFKPSG